MKTPNKTTLKAMQEAKEYIGETILLEDIKNQHKVEEKNKKDKNSISKQSKKTV